MMEDISNDMIERVFRNDVSARTVIKLWVGRAFLEETAINPQTVLSPTELEHLEKTIQEGWVTQDCRSQVYLTNRGKMMGRSGIYWVRKESEFNQKDEKMEEVKKAIEVLEYKIARCFPQYELSFSRGIARHIITGYHPITGTVMQHYIDSKLISQRTLDRFPTLFDIKDLPQEISEYAIMTSIHMMRSHANFIEKTWKVFKWKKEYESVPFEHKAESFFSKF